MNTGKDKSERHFSPNGRARIVDERTFSSMPGEERRALEWVADVVSRLGLPSAPLERLKTVVAEAVLNAMEHGLPGSGHHYQAECPVCVRVILSDAPRTVTVQVMDQGTDRPALPDLAAKLASAPSPRGWGFFLIEKLVDKVGVTGDTAHHLIEVVLYLEGGSHA